MEEKNKGLNINIEHYTGEKPIEVVYRLGDAAQAQQPLATKAPEKAEIEKQRDPSGSVADVYRCQVESNLPKSFTVNMAIFKGTAKQPIEIEFDHYLTNGEVFLQLVLPGANEVMESYRDKCIDEVLDKIKDIAPDIAILEV